MTARKERDSNRPLPRESCSGGRISGMTPYLAGTKKAEWVPMRKTVARTIHGPAGLPIENPTRATAVMPTSASFQATSEVRFEYRSASQPATVEKIAHGA